MRRLSSFLVLTLLATAVLAVFAVPSFAADGAKEAAKPEYSQWLGLQASLVAGVVMGFIGFFSAGTEGLDGHGDDH